MDILGLLKRIFPKPHIPQKRYLVLLGVVIYGAMKLYVSLTPDPSDDKIPDEIKDVVVHVFAMDYDPSSATPFE